MSDAKRWERLCDRLALGEELSAADEAWMRQRAEVDAASAAELEFMAAFELWDERASEPTDSASDLVRAALAEVDRAEAQGEPVGAAAMESTSTVERPRTLWWSLPLGVAAAAAAVVVAILTVGGDDPVRAHVARAEGEVFIDGEPMSGVEALAPGATVSVTHGEACLDIEPEIEVCLGEKTTAVLETADPKALRVEVRRGRAVATLDPLPEGQQFSLSHERVKVTAVGTVFELGVPDDGPITTTVHEGVVWAATGAEGIQLRAGESAVVRDGAIERVDAEQLAVVERRVEMDAAASAVEAPESAIEAPAQEVDAAAEPEAEPEAPVEAEPEPEPEPEAEPEPEPAPAAGKAHAARPPSADHLLAQARRDRQAGHWKAAAHAYARLSAAHPSTAEGRTALVSLGDLQLDRLGKPRAAAHSYGRYLAAGGGPLAQEARYGRVRAYRAAGDAKGEIAAIEAFLKRHPGSARAGALRSRLQTLQK